MNRSFRPLIRVVLGMLLTWAGIIKALSPSSFLMDLTDYHVPLPHAVWALVAVTLPWVEIICGFALTFDFWSETVQPLVAALFGVFVLMLAQAVFRGLDLNCGCFGRATASWTEKPSFALVRTIILFAFACFLLTRRRAPSGDS